MSLKPVLTILFAFSMAVLAVLLIYFSWHVSSPQFASYLDFAVPAFWILVILICGTSLYAIRRTGIQTAYVRACITLLILALVGTLVAASIMARHHWQFYQWTKQVISSDPATLQELGQHFVIGYRSDSEIQELASMGAIGGIYITRRNIENKSIAEIRHDIDILQNLRHDNNLPPLLIAADQEGGIVSRLTPPLPYHQTLSQQIASADQHLAQKIAFDFGKQQGLELASLGVNLNLSPVVDLHPQRKLINDKYTRIYDRAISNNPQKVSQIGYAYVKGLECKGVLASLKHFPGLEKITADTHVSTATLTTPIAELQQRDWFPFRDISIKTNAMIMLGHVNIPALDQQQPASLSGNIIQTIIRQDWQHNGVLITDDLTMGAVFNRNNNLLKTATTAINAGVDLLLISYDVRHFYPAMYGLLDSYEKGDVDKKRLSSSHLRLLNVQKFFQEQQQKPCSFQ
jgi:beta-N-acetylhexosaminidase